MRRHLAYSLLLTFGIPTTPIIAADPANDPIARAVTASTLGDSDDVATAVHRLLTMRTDPDPLVRSSADRAIQRLGRAATPIVLQAFQDAPIEFERPYLDVLTSLGPTARPARTLLIERVRERAKLTANDCEASARELHRLVQTLHAIDPECIRPLFRELLPHLLDRLREEDLLAFDDAAETLALAGHDSDEVLAILDSAIPMRLGGDGLTPVFGGGKSPAFLRAIDAAGPKGLAILRRRLLAPETKAETAEDLLIYCARRPRLEPELIASLTTILKESDHDAVKRAALRVVQAFGPAGRDLIPVVLNALSVEATHDEATETLCTIGSASVPWLSPKLRDPDERVRRAAAWILAEIGREAKPAIPALRELLGESDPALFRHVAVALVRAGDDPLPILREVRQRLRSEDKLTREFAASVLFEVPSLPPDWAPLLLDRLEDESALVYSHAAAALGRYGFASERAVPKLVERWKRTGDPRQRSLVLRGLAHFRAAAQPAMPILIESLGRDGPEPIEAIRVLQAMGSAGREAVPALLERIRKEAHGIEPSNHGLWAFVSIGGGAKDAVPFLLDQLVNGPAERRCWVIRALGAVGPEARAAIPVLRQLREVSVAPESWWAMVALHQIDMRQPIDKELLREAATIADSRGEWLRVIDTIGIKELPPESIDWLIAATSDRSNLTDRIRAVRLLGQFGKAAESAIQRLRPLIDDEDDELAIAAAEAIRLIQGEIGARR